MEDFTPKMTDRDGLEESPMHTMLWTKRRAAHVAVYDV